MPDTIKVKQVMDQFHGLLLKNLRKSDVFTRTALAQYSIILTVVDDIDIETIILRIQAGFLQICSAPNVSLEINQKELI